MRVFDFLHDLRYVADRHGNQRLHPLLREGVGAAAEEAAAAQGPAYGQPVQAHEHREPGHGAA